VQQILDFAYAKSLKNQPTKIANEAVELLEQVNRTMAVLYSFAAGINPTFFGKKATMTVATLTWPEPTDSEAIYYMEQGANEVVVVPVDEQDLEPGKLQVTSYGRTFYAASTAPPTANDIDAYYAKKADVEVSLSDNLDTTWDEGHNELVILEIALFLAIKDGRAEEVGGLIAQRDREFRRFVRRLENQLANVLSKYGPTRAITPIQHTVTPSELLLGEAG